MSRALTLAILALPLACCASSGMPNASAPTMQRRRSTVPRVSLAELRLSPAPPPSGIDPNAAARPVREHVTLIRICYERDLMAHPGLYGRVDVRYIIGRTGAVERVRAFSNMAGGDGAAYATVEDCIAGVFRRLIFPVPPGGTASMEFSFNFTPGSDPPIVDLIDSVAARNALGAQASGLRSCYDDALRANATLAAVLRARVTLDGSGHVLSARVRPRRPEPDGPTTSLAGCLSNALASMVFPHPNAPRVRLVFDVRCQPIDAF